MKSSDYSKITKNLSLCYSLLIYFAKKYENFDILIANLFHPFWLFEIKIHFDCILIYCRSVATKCGETIALP